MRGRERNGALLALLIAALMLWPFAMGAQVDWGELFPGEGGGSVAAPPPPPPPPVQKPAAPAAPRQPAPPPPAVSRPRPAAPAVAPTPQQARPPVVRAEPARPAPPAVPVVPQRPAEQPQPAAPRLAPRAPAPAPPVAVEEPETARVAPAPPREAPPAAAAPAAPAGTLLVSLKDYGLSEGMMITAENMAQFSRLLNPGMQWAVGRGWRMEVTAPKPMRPPRPYIEATEKYSGQVRLGAGGLSLENYVAGLPFPNIDINAPDAALKIMWNFYHNYHTLDDVSQNDFEPRTGMIRRDGTLEVERAYIVDSYRKMLYTGRLYVDPKPELPNPERVRFKEGLHPILQPYDLKGVGALFYRYLDANRQDDSWIYLPQLRRVRRMSSAQRSDALFGQDTDADSFGGYNGHIAWMDFNLLDEQVILLPMHARHVPAKWQEPEDWAFEDVWEPRRVWVIEARSKSAQYAFSKRVLYVDQEAFIIPNSDSYDRGGQLWKAQTNLYAQLDALTPDSKLARYDEPLVHQLATVIVDTQLSHATSTAIPSTRAKAPDSYVIHGGAKKGVTEEYFSVANLIATGH